jgi:hypothetical protein
MASSVFCAIALANLYNRKHNAVRFIRYANRFLLFQTAIWLIYAFVFAFDRILKHTTAEIPPKLDPFGFNSFFTGFFGTLLTFLLFVFVFIVAILELIRFIIIKVSVKKLEAALWEEKTEASVFIEASASISNLHPEPPKENIL